ncbi:MAG TPA: hypothetical protein DG753_11120 [Clostridium sp.]|nr:hypothetical protein [Clostridium sp.]
MKWRIRMERSVLKSNAKSQLKGKWFLTIAVMLVSGVIASVISGLLNLVANGLGTVASFCVSGIVTFGVTTYSLNVARNRNAAFTDLFDGFNGKVILKAIILGLIVTIATTAGLFLFVVPGIIISIMFSQSFYILIENNEMSPIDCIKESTEMMKGHKKEYFMLYLSIMGWAILMALVIAGLIINLVVSGSFVSVILIIIGGIATAIVSFILSAYLSIALANFYIELTSKKEIDYSEF